MAEKKSKSLWDAKIIRRALVDAVVKLDPRTMMKNPGHVRGRSGQRGDDLAVVPREAKLRLQSADHALALVHRAVCEFRGGHGRGPRQSASRHAAQSPVRNRGQAPAAERGDGNCTELEAAFGRRRDGCGGRTHPGRRRSHRRRRLGGRIRHHRRIRAGDPRSGRRPSAVTGGTRVLSDRDQSPHHVESRRNLPRPNDCVWSRAPNGRRLRTRSRSTFCSPA